MKRLFLSLLVAAVSLCCAGTLSAQNKFGVIGGATFSHANFREFSRGTMTQYHAGVTYRAKLPLGFSIQPSLIYQVKGAMTSSDGVDANATIGYLELPVSFQWGPDLILFRPYLEVAPFVGYSLNGLGVNNPISDWKSPDRLEYGVGLGGGVQIWRFQIGARYNWTFADIKNVKDANFNGVSLSLTFFFGKQKER